MQIRNLLRLNWTATCALNYHAGGLRAMLRMPIKVYGPLRWHLSGRILLPSAAVRNTLIIGSDHEDYTAAAGKAELNIQGTWQIEGLVRIGPDSFIGIRKGAVMTMGADSFFGRNTQIHCSCNICFGRDVIAGELYATDSAEHTIFHNGMAMPLTAPILVGDGTYLAHRTTLLKGTVIPPHSVVASYAVCTKDYSRLYAASILLAGIPATIKQTCVNAY